MGVAEEPILSRLERLDNMVSWALLSCLFLGKMTKKMAKKMAVPFLILRNYNLFYFLCGLNS